MGYPHSMSLPSIFSHWEGMDGHEMSLQSYPHSVSLPSIPSHCTTGNRWTDMRCPFSPTHTLYPYRPFRPTVPLGTDGLTRDVPSVLPTLYVPTVHPIHSPSRPTGNGWTDTGCPTHTLCPYRPSRPTGNGWADMGYPHSMSLPSIFSHWKGMDGHEMSLQSYPHSVSLPSIPSHCTTGNRWTDMRCPFSPTHTLYPYRPFRPTVPLGTDGRTWDFPSVLPTPRILTVHPVPLYHWEQMDGHGVSLQSYPHSVSLPSIPSHWERMDGHGISLQSYPHSVSLPFIPSHCTTGNGWTGMGCPFSPTHTLCPYRPSRPTVPLGTVGRTRNVPSILQLILSLLLMPFYYNG